MPREALTREQRDYVKRVAGHAYGVMGRAIEHMDRNGGGGELHEPITAA